MNDEALHKLKLENEALKAKLEEYKNRIDDMELQQRSVMHCLPCTDEGVLLLSKHDKEDVTAKALSIIVLGASGDLAKKKTYPALFSLHCNGMLPSHALLFGYARSDLPLEAFRSQIGSCLPGKDNEKKQAFLNRCFYFRGNYDSSESFAELAKYLEEKESIHPGANRIYYFAIPPTVFVASAKSIRLNSMSPSGWTRIVVEKPFGRDCASAVQLGKELGALFNEDQIFRIDHYLGKEMVQNLMVLRFANELFEPVWNRQHIASVQITFKEPFGTQGRGGYFDEFGIIRDVMQNHLIQILALVAMEPPVSLQAEDVRDEKAKLLRAVPPVTLENLVIGQYGPDKQGREPAYLDDPTVPKDSITPTYAAAILHINNSRWRGTPFILKCGKALDERKAEVRITFKKPASGLFLENDLAPNELVIRVQPDESVYCKMTIKKPGLSADTVYTELDLTYKDKFTQEGESLALPDAYERLIFDVIRGDHNLFVRDDELIAAWNIFTPLLHRLEEERIKPEPYEFGSRGPESAQRLISKYYVRVPGYKWKHHVAKSRV